MDAVWVNEVNIGTAESSGTWTYNPLCAGIENVSFANNEQAQQFFFLCGQGGSHNEVTGIAPVLNISGRRIVGDTAQDYIADMQFKLGQDRHTSVKLTAGGKQMVCDCTIENIVSFGGNSTDINAFSCEIHFNGIPTVTPAT